MKNGPTNADQTLAIELLALAQHHPAGEFESKEKAKRLLVELDIDLSSDLISATLERGKSRKLGAVVAELLGEG